MSLAICQFRSLSPPGHCRAKDESRACKAKYALDFIHHRRVSNVELLILLHHLQRNGGIEGTEHVFPTTTSPSSFSDNSSWNVTCCAPRRLRTPSSRSPADSARCGKSQKKRAEESIKIPRLLCVDVVGFSVSASPGADIFPSSLSFIDTSVGVCDRGKRTRGNGLPLLSRSATRDLSLDNHFRRA